MQRKRDVIRPLEDDDDEGEVEEYPEGGGYDDDYDEGREAEGSPYGEDDDDMDAENSDEGEGGEEEDGAEGDVLEQEREPLMDTPKGRARERRKDNGERRRRSRMTASGDRDEGRTITAKEHTLMWGFLATVLVGIVQCILIFDLLLEFVRFDFLGYFYLSFGVALWAAWVVCYGIMVHRTRSRMDPAMMKACVMMMYPMAYVILMVLCFSVIFIRWAHFFGGKTADIEDVDSGVVPFSEALLIKFGEATFVSLLPLTVYVLILLLMRYYELVMAQGESEARAASPASVHEG